MPKKPIIEKLNPREGYISFQIIRTEDLETEFNNSNHNRRRLNEHEVRYIRASKKSVSLLAREFNLSRQAMHDVKRSISYQEVE